MDYIQIVSSQCLDWYNVVVVVVVTVHIHTTKLSLPTVLTHQMLSLALCNAYLDECCNCINYTSCTWE